MILKNITISLSIFAFLLTSCQQTPKSATTICEDEEWVAEIQLNDNEAWQANTATNEGVHKLEQILTEFPVEDLKDYHQLANRLTEVNNFIIDNCTMQGKSHDNLHVWLYPVLEKVKALKQAETIAEAEEIKASISCSVKRYSTYFQ
jgi:flagellar basal body-associated protein FliL